MGVLGAHLHVSCWAMRFRRLVGLLCQSPNRFEDGTSWPYFRRAGEQLADDPHPGGVHRIGEAVVCSPQVTPEQ